MDKKVFVLGLVVALLVGGFVGIAVDKSNPLGAASITPYNALNNQILANELQTIANPLTGWIASSSVMSNVTVGSTTVATTSMTVTGAAVGDYLEWGESTSTANVNLYCGVSAANTVLCTKSTAVPGSAGIAAVTSTIYVLDLPRTSFVSPSGL